VFLVWFPPKSGTSVFVVSLSVATIQVAQQACCPGGRKSKFLSVALLKQLVADGRSTPGAEQENDVPVDIWKLETMPSVDPRMLDLY
jgi:hypothetical protein